MMKKHKNLNQKLNNDEVNPINPKNEKEKIINLNLKKMQEIKQKNHDNLN